MKAAIAGRHATGVVASAQASAAPVVHAADLASTRTAWLATLASLSGTLAAPSTAAYQLLACILNQQARVLVSGPDLWLSTAYQEALQQPKKVVNLSEGPSCQFIHASRMLLYELLLTPLALPATFGLEHATVQTRAPGSGRMAPSSTGHLT